MSPLSPVTPISERMRSSRLDEEQDVAQSLTTLGRKTTSRSHYSVRSATGSTYSASASVNLAAGPGGRGHADGRRGTSAVRNQRPIPAPDPIITISAANKDNNHLTAPSEQDLNNSSDTSVLDDDDDYVTVEHPSESEANQIVARDKASRVLGIGHRKSMEPIPASHRVSVASARSVPAPESSSTTSGPTLPLASLYVVSGLPKSPHTWTLADPDSVIGVHHSDGAVGRWWRPEVLGSTVSPGAGGGRKKRKSKVEEISVFSSSGHLTKQEVGKMLSKALKVRNLFCFSYCSTVTN